jgi:KUP system potassium uptake protein
MTSCRFAANAAIGLYNIIHYYPSVWKGLSPSYIYFFWKGDAHVAWKRLGPLMLCITGAEALYADLGHFNARAVQVSCASRIVAGLFRV